MVSPASGSPSRAPGTGKITISDITASSDTTAPDQPVRLSAVIGDQNIGYIYLYIEDHLTVYET